MCGRYNLYTGKEELAERFLIANAENLDIEENYNIAPGQPIFTVLSDGARRLGGYVKWGLVPSWAKNPKIGYKMINARAETVDVKPSFSRLLKRRRCLIAADGFYEWRKMGHEKQPYLIRLKTGKPFGFAGLWDKWTDGTRLMYSCTIITAAANSLMEEIHDRMPVILTEETEAIWLNKSIQEPVILKNLLAPYPAGEMEAFPVSKEVNSPSGKGPEMLNSL